MPVTSGATSTNATSTNATSTNATSTNATTTNVGTTNVGAPVVAGQRHDPRIDPPTRADRRRLLGWVALLGLTPVCIGVVLWATFGLNGTYPMVKPPVPPGWQSVPGIYASFSAPKSWSLQPAMSDSAGDTYYSGRSGAVGESVVQSRAAPIPPHGSFPAILETFLGGKFKVLSVSPWALRHATVAWRYRFSLANGGTGTGALVWAKATQSRIWLVGAPATQTAEHILSTLRVAG